jgi:hypothetical protein
MARNPVFFSVFDTNTSFVARQPQGSLQLCAKCEPFSDRQLHKQPYSPLISFGAFASSPRLHRPHSRIKMELPFRPQQQSFPQFNRNCVEYQPKRFNVGVDFGSTYSAATFVLLSASTTTLQAGKIQNIPYRVATSHNRLHCYEVPTVLRYEDICTRWGWDAKRVQESGEALPGKFIDMIKLLLDEAEHTEEVKRDELRRRVADDIRKLDKTVVGVLVDYLTPFFKHIMDHMIDKGYYDPRDKVELECTVPAIWKEKSRRKMLAAIDKAGQKSGFGFGKSVWLVSEPEAAASYVLKMNPNWNLQVSLMFGCCILCDGLS